MSMTLDATETMEDLEADVTTAAPSIVFDKPTTILLLGASGQLGNALHRYWQQPQFAGQICQVPSLHESVDISNRKQIREQVSCIHPDVIVNCAGFTDTRLAEDERDECWRTNVLGTKYLAECCLDNNAHLLQFSSNFLFGLDNTHYKHFLRARQARSVGLVVDEEDEAELEDPRYTELSPPAPIGHLATTQLAAEHVLMQTRMEDPAFESWVVRTACLFEPPWRKGHNFLYSVAARLMSRDEPLTVASDVYTNICYTPHLAEIVTWMLAYRHNWCPSGVYNIVNAGAPSLYEIAYRVAMGLRLPPDRVRPVTTKVDNSPKRYYTALSTDKYEGLLYAPELPSWQDAVDEWCLDALESF